MTDPDKGELPGSDTEIVETKIDKKALDTLCTKMSNLQGEFLKNADSLAWLLKLMVVKDHKIHHPQQSFLPLERYAFQTQPL